MEVSKDVFVFFLILLLHPGNPEDGRDVLREAQELSNNGVASAHKLQDHLSTNITFL